MFRDLPLLANLGVFAGAAVVVWLVGTRLSKVADEIAERYHLGRAFIGLVLLAVATSLPELATTVTASVGGNPSLAVNNLLGGVVMQTAIVALADAAFGRGALTHFTPRPALLLEGVGVVVLLGLVLAAMAAGPIVHAAGVSVSSVILVVTYAVLVAALHHAWGSEAWEPVDPPPEPEEKPEAARTERTGARLLLAAGVSAGLLLVAGWTLATSADAIAKQTGSVRASSGPPSWQRQRLSRR